MERQWDYSKLNVKAFKRSYVAGLDLGQAQDPAAVAMIQRTHLVYHEFDPYSYNPVTRTDCRLVYAERLPLGTPYTKVVERVCTLVQRAPFGQAPALVVDATGVGAPVVDLFKVRNIPGGLVPVVITGGDSVTQDRGTYRVPKRDLIAGLQVAFQKERLILSRGVASVETLIRELMSMRASVTAHGHERFASWREGDHDDLVLATGLAWWWMEWSNKPLDWPPPQSWELGKMFY